MKAEEFIKTWLNKKYAGAKEVGEWTTAEVESLVKDYQKQVWEEVQAVSVELEDFDTDLTEYFVLVDDLEKILEIKKYESRRI